MFAVASGHSTAFGLYQGRVLSLGLFTDQRAPRARTTCSEDAMSVGTCSRGLDGGYLMSHVKINK